MYIYHVQIESRKNRADFFYKDQPSMPEVYRELENSPFTANKIKELQNILIVAGVPDVKDNEVTLGEVFSKSAFIASENKAIPTGTVIAFKSILIV